MPRVKRQAKFRLPVFLEFKRIREAFGWSTTQLAREMGMSQSKISYVERGYTTIGMAQYEMLREVTGIDPYVLAYCKHFDFSKLPGRLPELHKELAAEWDKQMEIMKKIRHRLPLNWDTPDIAP